MKENKLLLIVDAQVDFINGSLPVSNAQEAMCKLTDYVKENGDDYTEIVCTLDWHPSNHSSFSEFGGQWPSHCVQHTMGACIFPLLMEELKKRNNVTFLTKGDNVAVEEYSIFANDSSMKKLCTIVSTKKIDKIEVCGIAGDICVLNTLKDGVGIFGTDKFRVLTEFSPSLDGGKALQEFIDEKKL